MGTSGEFELGPLLSTLTNELLGKDDVPTKSAALRWINMLLEKRRLDMNTFVLDILPVLIKTLSHTSDSVVLLTLQVLARISLPPQQNIIGDEKDISKEGKEENTKKTAYELRLSQMTESHKKKEDSKDSDGDAQFQIVLNSILEVFAADRRLLETRGSLILRNLCVLLNAKSVYMRMADALSSREGSAEGSNTFALEFVATMVQTLNLILLTAAELHSLRALLSESFAQFNFLASSKVDESKDSSQVVNEGTIVFISLFNCWCHNPVALFSLCLLSQAYDLAFSLVKKFSELEVTVGFLMQIDKLINLLESPIFVHLRLQLLDVEKPYHTHLLKSCYGLLMLIPQSDAFRSLNDRLTVICNLRDNLNVKPSIVASPAAGVIRAGDSSVAQSGLDAATLLSRFDEIMGMHRNARESVLQQDIQQEVEIVDI